MNRATIAPDNAARQRVLDAVVTLQGRRRAAVAAIEAGQAPPDARVVASGRDLASWMMRDAQSWQHLLSTRATTTGRALSRSLGNNRQVLARGMAMTSVFDFLGTDEAARSLLEGEPGGVYFFAYAPIDMRLIERRRLYLHGPCGRDGDSIICLTSPTAVEAALAY